AVQPRGPVPAPAEGGDEVLAGGVVAGKESGMAPAGFAAGSADGKFIVDHRNEFPGALLAPLLVLCVADLEDRLPGFQALGVLGSVPDHAGPRRDAGEP